MESDDQTNTKINQQRTRNMNSNNQDIDKEKLRRTNLKNFARNRLEEHRNRSEEFRTRPDEHRTRPDEHRTRPDEHRTRPDEQNNKNRVRTGEQIRVKPIKTTNENISQQTTKLTEYRGYNIPELKQVYVQLLNDNLQHLIEYIYLNKDKDSYNSPSVRVALAMQMILASNQLIPYQISSMIAKDIDDLRKNDEYINQWEDPSLKRKALLKELEFLKKHTEIDETISLNLTDKPNEDEHKNSLKDFEINSGISTLNVSSKFPIGSEVESTQSCCVM